MATVGQQLTTPEAGWKRYDDSDSNIYYSDSPGWIKVTNSIDYGGSCHQANGLGTGSYAQFNFLGTKFRLISVIHFLYSKDTTITIDGKTYPFNIYGDTLAQALVFEIIGLSEGEHSVFIKQNTPAVQTGVGLVIDAIDIDENGGLKPYSPISIVNNPTNLTATPGDAQVTLNWAAVTGATGYNLKRSLTVGGPYETIATTVAGTSYVDTNVVNGTTYYYVVTTVDPDGESANSNEASATPQAAPVEEGNVLLRITMNDSSEREYPLTAAELDSFINWFNKHTSTDDTSFMFNKTVGTQASKEYLAFNKIISFEVIPLPAE